MRCSLALGNSHRRGGRFGASCQVGREFCRLRTHGQTGIRGSEAKRAGNVATRSIRMGTERRSESADPEESRGARGATGGGTTQARYGVEPCAWPRTQEMTAEDKPAGEPSTGGFDASTTTFRRALAKGAGNAWRVRCFDASCAFPQGGLLNEDPHKSPYSARRREIFLRPAKEFVRQGLLLRMRQAAVFRFARQGMRSDA